MKKVGTLKNEQGIAHLVLIVLAVIVLAAIGGAAWRVSSSKKDSKSTATNSSQKAVSDSEVEKACLKEVNDKELCKFASNYKLDGVSYKAVITSVAPEGKSVMTMEVDSKNNSSMVTSQDGKEVGAFISLDKATYTKDLDGKAWTKYSAAAETPADTNPTKDIDFKPSDFTSEDTVSYKSQGKEACGKLTCFKYQIIDSKTPAQEQYLWFDTKDYMLQRWSTKDAQGTSDMVFTYQNVIIKEPSPVHEMSATPSAAEMDAAMKAMQQAGGEQ
jgi:outer membrane lipoprotein-sorting protein